MLIMMFKPTISVILVTTIALLFGCTPRKPEVYPGSYKMEIPAIGVTDTLTIKSDLSWRHEVSYKDKEGKAEQIVEEGIALLGTGYNDAPYIRFDGFTYVFDENQELKKTSLKKPVKVTNVRMYFEREEDEFFLIMDLDYGYVYKRFDVSVNP